PGGRRGGLAASGRPDVRPARHLADEGTARLGERFCRGSRPVFRGPQAAVGRGRPAAGGAPGSKSPLTYGAPAISVKFCDCWRSSGAEQLPCKQWVGGSNPPASASDINRLQLLGRAGRYPSGQRGQTVNLLADASGGSNPPLPTNFGIRRGRCREASGNSSAVERQPSKLGVAGSNPVSRSMRRSPSEAQCARVSSRAHVAQSAERVLGKDEVSGSSPDMGSIFTRMVANGE